MGLMRSMWNLRCSLSAITSCNLPVGYCGSSTICVAGLGSGNWRVIT